MVIDSDHERFVPIYTRVSVQWNEGQESIEEPIDSARRYAEEHDLEIVEVDVDREVITIEGIRQLFEKYQKELRSESARRGWRTRRARADQNEPQPEA